MINLPLWNWVYLCCAPLAWLFLSFFPSFADRRGNLYKGKPNPRGPNRIRRSGGGGEDKIPVSLPSTWRRWLAENVWTKSLWQPPGDAQIFKTVAGGKPYRLKAKSKQKGEGTEGSEGSRVPRLGEGLGFARERRRWGKAWGFGFFMGEREWMVGEIKEDGGASERGKIRV